MSINSEYKRECAHIQMFLGEIGEMLGRVSGFVQRRSKLGGKEMIQILTLGCLESGEATLEMFCQVAQELGIEVSASGLHQRLNAQAIELLQQTCQLWLSQSSQASKRRDVLCHFEAVHIIDSSRIQLPEVLHRHFKGGRNGATMKVQLAYEYHTGQIEALDIEPASHPDQTCQLPQQICNSGDLVLFDLGYFDQKRFEELHRRGVYFVSRLQSQVATYEIDETRLELLDWLNTLPAQHLAGEHDILLGRVKKVPMRLVYHRLPSNVVAERRRKAKKAARKLGKTCSKMKLDRLAWSLLITNVPAHILTVEQVPIVYRVRWQIEILFKVWKQELNWASMRSWRFERMLCQFYARCLALLLFHSLTAKYHSQVDWQLSWQKALRLLKRKAYQLIVSIRRNFYGLLSFLQRFDRDIQRFARQNQRRTSLSTYQLLKLFHA